MKNNNDLKNKLLTYISLRIKHRREELGLTQSELAKSVGLTRTSITNIESAKTQIQIITLLEISNKLKVKLDYFFPQEFLSSKTDTENITIDYTSYFNSDIDEEDEQYISNLIDNI